MEFEAGYFAEREEMPLAPFVGRDGLFAQHAEMIVGALRDTDGPLASLGHTIAGNVADGLDGLFASTIGAAEAEADTHAGAGDDPTAGYLTDAGAGTDAYHDDAQRYLPQPDSPIESNFLDLPTPPAGHPGGGGNASDDPNKD
jgi:hypothetical protein